MSTYPFSLFGFRVNGVFAAEPAILIHFHLVRRVFLVLHGIVVSLLTVITSQSHFHAHLFGTSYSLAPGFLLRRNGLPVNLAVDDRIDVYTTKKTSLPTGRGSITWMLVVGQGVFARIFFLSSD